MNFKKNNSLNERIALYRKLTSLYSDRIPIIIEPHEGSDIPLIDKYKYLVPTNTSLTQFSFIIRKRLKLTAEKALYLFHESTLYTGSTLVSQIPQEEDGFRYLKYAGENTFGCFKLNDILAFK